MDYYYQNPGAERAGPMDETTFWAHAGANAVAPNAVVWREGEETWQVWATVAAVWAKESGCEPEASGEEEVESGLISADVGIDSFFGDAWMIFKNHWGKFVLTGMLMGILTLLSEGGNKWVELRERAGEPIPENILWGLVSASLIFSIISGTFVFGYLKIARKEDALKEVRARDIFPLGRSLRKMFKFLGAGLVYGLIATPIYLLTISPLLYGIELQGRGVSLAPEEDLMLFSAIVAALFLGGIVLLWLMIRLLFVVVFIFDTDCGVFGAFKASWRITRNRFWRTFGYGILAHLILFFGTLFTLGIGAIILMPLSVLWFCVYYIKLCKTCEADVPASRFSGNSV